MSFREKVSANRNDIAIAIAIVLFAVGMAYSNGWLSPSAPVTELISPKLSASQPMEPAKTKQEADKVTLKTTKPAGQATE
jgi:hypothetical protein